MLVFSTTSLQLRLISPSNPRALYFSEDLYVGFIPGGRIEIVSLDPEIGGIYYIFDIPRGERRPRIERSDRCMNCHASADTQYVPGLATNRIEAGTRFDFARYPASTSDILAHLLLEHQTGFVNRVLEVSYRARTYLHEGHRQISAKQAEELDRQAGLVARYLLFADEAPVPPGGLEGDAVFKADFLRTRRAAASGLSLKDLDLRTRLFKHRCSYMIYSLVFRGLPQAMKERIYACLALALSPEPPSQEFDYLPPAEKQSIRAILKDTLTDLPAGW